jgi:hypothetical protein
MTSLESLKQSVPRSALHVTFAKPERQNATVSDQVSQASTLIRDRHCAHTSFFSVWRLLEEETDVCLS